MRLPRSFFQRSTLEVAPDLIGKVLVRREGKRSLKVRLNEVEAYIGEEDLACHAAKGRTARTEVMYGEAGHLYVYLVYGLHHCLNIVTEGEGFPAAVLIRGGIPLVGWDIMQKRRGRTPLTDGPGKLCQALGIDREDSGSDVCKKGSMV